MLCTVSLQGMRMRASIMAALAAGFLISSFGSGVAQMPTAGTGQGTGAGSNSALSEPAIWDGAITGVDAAKLRFTCHGPSGDKTFVTDTHTRLRSVSGEITFADLKAGEKVAVVSHHAGNQNVADQVTVTP
jgi:hypothetical protein